MVRAQPAPTIEITPNAIQKLDEPMRINVTVSRGASVYVFILRSCDSNPATPELRSRDNCKTPLWRRNIPLDHRGQGHYELHFTKLSEQPVDEQLWVRVSIDPEGRGPYGQTIFTIRGSGACSLRETLLGLFSSSRCTVGAPLLIIPDARVTLDELRHRGDEQQFPGRLAASLYDELDEGLSLGILHHVGVCIGGDGCGMTEHDPGIEVLLTNRAGRSGGVDGRMLLLRLAVGWGKRR